MLVAAFAVQPVGPAEAKPRLTKGQAARATVRYLERNVGGTATVDWCHRKRWGYLCQGTVRDFTDYFVEAEPGDALSLTVSVRKRHGRIRAWNEAWDS